MNQWRFRSRRLCQALLAFSLPAVVAADKQPPIPTLADIATVWIGEGPDTGPEYYRLEIEPDGRGILTIQYIPHRPAIAYRVNATRLQRYAISLDLTPVDLPEETVYASGTAIRGELRLRVGSERPKWNRKVRLTPYREVLERIDTVTQRAREVAATPGGSREGK